MRILFVDSRRPWDGFQAWCLRTARHLQARGHEVWVAGAWGGALLDACRDADVSVLPLPAGTGAAPLRLAALHTFLRKRDVEIALCGRLGDLATLGLATRGARLPLVLRAESRSDIPTRLPGRASLKATRPLLLVPSQSLKDGWRAQFPAWTMRDLEVLWPATEAPARVAPRGPDDRLACLAPLADGQGLEDLLRALAILQGQGRQTQLDILGVGPAEARLRALAAGLGLEDFVRFPGCVRPAGDALSLAGVGVLPMPILDVPDILLEYWSAGLAVVACDLPVVREAVGASRAARLVRPGDPGSLAAALAELLEDPAESARLAEEGFRRVHAAFSAAQEVERLEDLLASHANRAFLA